MSDSNTPLTPAQERKAANDVKLAELEELLSALSPEDRRLHFFENKDAASLELVNLLSQKVDGIKNSADRKAFFLAHPELEVRYSAKNFIK